MKRFLALSRSTHGLLDIAMPGFVALLWLGHFPEWKVLGLCLLVAVAGYTAIYALNDLIGVRDDEQKVAGGINPGYAVEASQQRYPLAQKLLSLRAGWTWFGVWLALAVAGLWLLNPWILLILGAAAMLEIVYVKLLKRAWWRVGVSGLVKAAGPLAAVFAVLPNPDLAPLLVLVAWLMLWEIGGQNIPADWNDIDEDRRIGARTIVLRFGLHRAARVVLVSLLLAVLVSLLLPLAAPRMPAWHFHAALAVLGIALLLLPALRLARTRHGRDAARLFDRASLYPLALLALVTVYVLVPGLSS